MNYRTLIHPTTRRRLTDILQDAGAIGTSVLCSVYGVAPDTARRILQDMAQDGLIVLANENFGRCPLPAAADDH